MPRLKQTANILRITKSRSLRLLPPPRMSSAFLKQSEVLRISGAVDKSNTSGEILNPWGNTVYLNLPWGSNMVNMFLHSSLSGICE